MKKLSVLLISVFILIAITACGTNSEKTTLPKTDDMSGSEYAGEPMEICLAHNLAVGSVMDNACNKFTELVDKKSGGKIKVIVNPAAALGNERDMIEGIQMGTIDICLATTAYLSNIRPEFTVLDLPFVFDDLSHVKKCLDGEVGQRLSDLISKENNIKILSFWNSGFRDMMTSKVRLENLDSFKGLQIRAPEADVYIKMFRALGAAPIALPFSDVYTAINTGMAEGVEVSADQMYTMHFHEVNKYIAKTRHIFTTVVPICMNTYWDDMDEGARKIIKDAMSEVTLWEWTAFEESNDRALNDMAEQGIQINEIDRDALRKTCLGVYDEIAEKNNCKDLLDKILKK